MNSKTILASILLFAFGSASAVSAEAVKDQGHGKVTFKGSIISAPCSISPDSVDQTVPLGEVSNMALVDGGKSTPRTFDVKLENCNVADIKQGVQLTFTGASASFDKTGKTLGIVGTGAGAGVQITNGGGNILTLGQPTPFQKIQHGDDTLLFSAYLIGNGGDVSTITSGDFSAVADFTLNYQ